ncbi:MAG: TIGR02302 family protein [Pikeienuella sp.]
MARRSDRIPARMTDSEALIRARTSIRREAKRTRLSLWVEQLIEAFWPAWAVVALFAGLVLLGVPATLSALWHMVLLAVFGIAVIAFLARGVFRLRAPSDAQTLARLDQGTPGQPAQMLDDALASGAGDRDSEKLWAAHRARLARKAVALRAPAPDLRASNHDRFALRHAALLILFAGSLGYFGGTPNDIGRQLSPGDVIAATPEPVATLEAWASPPVYTGVAPVYLTRLKPEDRALTLPAGTEISLRVFDASALPTLTNTLTGGEIAFVDQGGGVFDATFTISRSGEIAVTHEDSPLGRWAVTVTPDLSPEIDFAEPPKADGRGTMSLSFEAQDDYGVRNADAVVTLDTDATPPVTGLAPATVFEGVTLELPLPLTGDNTAVAETLNEDLSEHPFAGLPVIITLTAFDAAGQEGSTRIAMDLPGRRFTHPLARALVEQRRALVWSPEAAPRVLDILEAVMTYPEEVFDDTTAFLAARMAVRRLGYALEGGRVAKETPGVVALLWKAAIRLEEGDLSTAAARLARARERLQQAIEDGASEEELAELMQELREAMRDFLAEMQQEAQRDQANGQQQQQQQGQQGETLTQDDIEAMMDKIEEAMKNGQAELAQQMLQALQQMMNNMQMAQPGQGQPGQGEQTMNQMGDMIGDQQSLADRSFDQMRREQAGETDEGGTQRGHEGEQNGAHGDDPGDDAAQIARDQRELQQLLDQLRNNLPGSAGEETREALDEANRAMDDAVEALRDGDTRQAVDDQVRALDALRDGRNQMANDMAEAQGQRDGEQAGRDGRGGDARDEDPLGRPRASEGPVDGESTNVPSLSLGKRAKELQDEIRRRSGERERPAPELDYLKRLLDRF